MPERSPVIFWLLLGATLCVNGLVFIYMGQSSRRHEIASFAILSSQVSLVCIWFALRSVSWIWSATFVIAAVVAAATVFRGTEDFWIVSAYFGLQAVVALTFLWFFKRTTFWARRSGNRVKFEFSIAHLLLATTAVAILVTVLKASGLFEFDAMRIIALLMGNILATVASATIWSLSWHWFFRLAATYAAAILLGIAYHVTGDLFLSEFGMINFLTQAAVFSAWLGLGGVLPMQNSAAEPAAPPAS
jgi:hypothetical protein